MQEENMNQKGLKQGSEMDRGRESSVLNDLHLSCLRPGQLNSFQLYESEIPFYTYTKIGCHSWLERPSQCPVGKVNCEEHFLSTLVY